MYPMYILYCNVSIIYLTNVNELIGINSDLIIHM